MFIQFLKNFPLVDLGTKQNRHWAKSKKIALRFALKEAGAGKTALDMGCGDGYWSEKLSSLGYKTTSIDLEKNYPQARVVNLDQDFPFSDGSFDLVWSTDVIEHLQSPRSAIQEIKRILKPKGIAVISTPNSYFWLYPLMRIFGYTPKDLQNPDHKHFFSLSDIKELFPRSKILGFFPYILLKFTITNPKALHYLSPTFIIVTRKEDL